MAVATDPTSVPTPVQDLKVCTKCDVPKERSTSDFHRSSKHRDGLYPICKQCVSAYQKQRYANFSPEEKQHHIDNVRAWRKSPKGKAYQKGKEKARRQQRAADREARGSKNRPEAYKYGTPSPTYGTPEYRAWLSMKARCYIPSAGGYAHYGGRGIRVCERWRGSFDNFLADMGLRPPAMYGVGRIDPEGDYTPDNCQWMTRREMLAKRRQPTRRVD
jgi:hypothetical protein